MSSYWIADPVKYEISWPASTANKAVVVGLFKDKLDKLVFDTLILVIDGAFTSKLARTVFLLKSNVVIATESINKLTNWVLWLKSISVTVKFLKFKFFNPVK